MANAKGSKRIWLWLLGSAGILVAVGTPAAYLGGRYYLKQRALGWRKEGMAAAAAGDNEKAADLLFLYLRHSPQDLDALEAFIGAREQVELPNGQHIAQTVSALKTVLGIVPDRLQDREHLLKLYVRIQRRPEALDTANAILAQISKMPKPQADKEDVRTIKAECLGLKTEALVGLNQSRDALNVADEWIAASPPGALPPQMMRMDIRFRLGTVQVDDIIKDAQAQADAHPKDASSELLLGYALLHAGEQRQQEATMWLRSAARDADPHSDLVRILVAQFDTIGVASDTISVLQDLVDRGAGTDIRHALACRYWEQGKWQQCVDLLADLNPADAKSDSTLLALKVISLSNLSKTSDAAACRTALGQHKSSAAQAWMLILPRIISAADVDDKKIIEACRQALALNRQDPYLSYYLGDSYARMGETDLAIDLWKQATGYGPTWNMPASRLVEALIQKGKPDQAYFVARSAERRSPTSPSAAIAFAHAWAAGVETGDIAHADDLLRLVTAIQAELPGEEQTLLIRIQLLARSGKTADAMAAARSAIAQTKPPSEQFLINLAAASRKFKLDIEEEILAYSEKVHGNTAAIAYARAVNQFLGGDAAGGLKGFDQAAAKPGHTGEDYIWKLARARYLDVTGSPDASAAWLALSDAFPANLTVQSAVASARAVAGNWDIMSKVVDRLHAISGDQGLQWRLAQGRMYIQCARNEDDYLKGSLVLNNLVKDYPALPEAHVLLSRALVHMNRMDGAVEHLQLAARLDPNSVPIAIELAALLRSRGEFDRVQQELDRITPLLRTADDRRMAAAEYARAGAAGKAVTLMEQPTATQAAPQDDLFMAMLYRKQGQIDKAQAIITKLLEKPDLATVQFAASLYLSQAKKAETEKVLALLDQIKLEPAIKELIWGSYYLETGDAAASIAQYQAAVKKAPANPVTWRSLAAVCMELGKKDDAIAAIKSGAQAVPDDKGLQAELAQADLLRQSMDDPTLAGVVMIYHRNPLAGDAALEMMKLVAEGRRANDINRLAGQLQQFIERHDDFMPAYIRLAQCYADMNRTSNALTAAMHAMSVFPNDPEPARIATEIAGATQRWSDMRTTAESWKKRSNDPNADVALARALLGLGQYEAARNQLAPYMAVAKANPDQYAGLLSVYAGAQVNFGQEKDAEDMLWPLAQKNARWRGVWVDTSLTFRDAKVTLAWSEMADAIIPKDAPAERLGIAEAFDILGRRGNDPQLIQKATQLAAQIADAAPQNLVAQLTAAAQAERGGDAKSAETFYRRVLAIDAKQWVANNNLAMLILKRSGDPKEAVACAQIAVKAQPRSANIYDTLAAAQSRAGDPKSAVETIHTALNLTPDNLAYQIRLAQYLLDSGQQAAAIAKIREIDQNGLPSSNLDALTKTALDDLRKRVHL